LRDFESEAGECWESVGFFERCEGVRGTKRGERGNRGDLQASVAIGKNGKSATRLRAQREKKGLVEILYYFSLLKSGGSVAGGVEGLLKKDEKK